MSYHMRLIQNYEDGDPASPEDLVAIIEKDGVELVTINFHNEDNEDIQTAIELMMKHLFNCETAVESNVDNHYYSR